MNRRPRNPRKPVEAPEPMPVRKLMYTNKVNTPVRLWPKFGTAQLPINMEVLVGKVEVKDWGRVAFCSFTQPVRGLFTAGWIKWEDLSPTKVVIPESA